MTAVLQDNTATSDGQAPAPSPEEEFDAAWAEAKELTRDPAEAASGSSETGSPSDAVEEPAPAQGAAAETPVAAEEAPAGEPQDIWASADPRLRQAYEEFVRDAELRIQTFKGRQSAADREAEKLRQQLASLQQGRQQQQPDAGGGNQAEASPPPDAVSRLRAEYPEVAGPLLDLIESQRAELQKLQQSAGSYEQDRAQAEERRQVEILARDAPDWQQVVTDDRFTGWLQGKPTAIREAFERNREKWVDGADAALVVNLFRSEIGSGQQRQAPPATPAPMATLDQRRSRQIAAGRDAGRTGPAATSSPPDDNDIDGWHAHYKRQASLG